MRMRGYAGYVWHTRRQYQHIIWIRIQLEERWVLCNSLYTQDNGWWNGRAVSRINLATCLKGRMLYKSTDIATHI